MTTPVCIVLLMSEVKSGGNPMVRAPEALHPLIREFARLYRLGKHEEVVRALGQALTALSTGVMPLLSKYDNSPVLVDVLARLERLEKGFSQMPTIAYTTVDNNTHTSDNGVVDTELRIGDSDNALVPINASCTSVDNNSADPTDSQVQELRKQMADQQEIIINLIGQKVEWCDSLKRQGALEQELAQLRSQPLDKDDAATRVEAIAEPEAEDAEPEPVAPLVADPEPEGTAIAEPKANTKQPLREQITKNTRYIQSQLAARFGKFTKKGYPDCSQLSSNKNSLLFIAWSRERDPEQIGWRYDGKRYFYPVL